LPLPLAGEAAEPKARRVRATHRKVTALAWLRG
jgi:hypothetical protein